KPIAVTSLKRAPLLKDVPTMDEQGLKGFDIQAWGGLVAPAGVPADIIDLLNTEINKALQNPDIRQTILGGGGVPQGGTSAAFKQFISDESARWQRVIGASGLPGQ